VISKHADERHLKFLVDHKEQSESATSSLIENMIKADKKIQKI
jgi:hypothetical protein